MKHTTLDVLILIVAVVGTTISLIHATCEPDFYRGFFCGIVALAASIIWLEDFK